MCGICGGWLNAPISDEALERALDSMHHRGPDGRGKFRDQGLFLGSRRLAIIDLDGGSQPVSNEDGTVNVVFNGEIYNYLELTDELKLRGHVFRSESDTETLVHLYEEMGAGMCRRLRGMFGFAIWDSRKQRLLVARDVFGKKPLYYTRPTTGGILFASELKTLASLARASGMPWSIRDQAIYDYLSLGVVPQPNTAFNDVYSLPPASILEVDSKGSEVHTYWTPTFEPKATFSFARAQEEVRSVVGHAVSIRLRSDVPLGVFLSAGVDSTVVAYEAAQRIGSSLRAFTVSMGSGKDDESGVAANTAKSLGIRHEILPLQMAPYEGLMTVVRHYDQPYADSSAIPSLAISKLARQHVTVILNGDGGDEVFAGYRRYMATRYAWLLRAMPKRSPDILSKFAGSGIQPRSGLGLMVRFARAASLQGIGSRYLTWTNNMFQESDKRSAWLRAEMRPTEQLLEELSPQGLSALDTQLHMDIRLNLLSDLLVKMDMATMSSSIESRSPLLDQDVADMAMRLPDDYRIRGGTLKAALREAYRGRIPGEVLSGPKRGFEVPLVQWLNHDFKELLRDTVGQKNAMIRTYLDDRYLDDILEGRRFADKNWAATTYSLLVLELWMREWNAGQLAVS